MNTPFEIDGMKMIMLRRDQNITDFASRITSKYLIRSVHTAIFIFC